MTADPNITDVEQVAAALGPLREELVLVGGCAVGLLITDKSRPAVRHTVDVDLITEVTPLANYYEFCERLREQGFKESSSSEVLCRWRLGELTVDIMPTEEGVLKFTNSWYAEAARTAVIHELPGGTNIKVIIGPLFLATKLESFHSRGNGDYMHHDMEDAINVIDGRPSIAEDVRNASSEVQEYLADEFEALLLDPVFDDRLSWHLAADKTRKPIVLERIRKITGL